MTEFIQGWLNEKESNKYPLHDFATCTTSVGVELPQDIFTDCFIIVPNIYGDDATVSLASIAITAGLASLAFSVWSGGIEYPIAIVNTLKPCNVGQYYNITPISEGVSGWVTFGAGVNELVFNGRFDTQDSGKLIQRVYDLYDTLPAQYIGKENVPPLTGLVNLRAGQNLEIVGADRVINGEETRCIVIRLSEDLDYAALAEFAGPCGKRPENDTCDNHPILSINGVEPDCAGNITLELSGCDAYLSSGESRIDIVSPLDMQLICKDKYLPTINGCLPDESVEDCIALIPDIPETESSIEIPEEESSEESLGYDCSEVEGMSSSGDDVLIDFSTAAGTSFFTRFGPVSETWGYASCSLLYSGTSQYSYAVSDCLTNAKNRFFRTIVSTANPNSEAYVILGLRKFGAFEKFFSVGIDFTNSKYFIKYFKGSRSVTLLSTTASTPLPTVDDDGNPYYYDIVVAVDEIENGVTLYLWTTYSTDKTELFNDNLGTAKLTLPILDTARYPFIDGLSGVGAFTGTSDFVTFDQFKVQWFDVSRVDLGLPADITCVDLSTNIVFDYDASLARELEFGTLAPAINDPLTENWKDAQGGEDLEISSQESSCWTSEPDSLEFPSSTLQYGVIPAHMIFGNSAFSFEAWFNSGTGIGTLVSVGGMGEANSFFAIALNANCNLAEVAGTISLCFGSNSPPTGENEILRVALNYWKNIFGGVGNINVMPAGLISAGTGINYDSTLTGLYGSWVHLVCTYDGTTPASGIVLYINGEVQSATSTIGGSSALALPQSDWLVGKPSTTYENIFDGYINTLRLYNVVLSADSVAELYARKVNYFQ